VKVGEVCNREVVTADRETTVTEAAKRMRHYHVGDLVVELLAKEVDVRLFTLGEVMTFDLITAEEKDDVAQTLEKMKNHGVRRIPVIDAGGKLAGIFAVDDLIELIAEQLSDVITLFRRQELKEKNQRN